MFGEGSEAGVRYIIRAKGETGAVEFREPLTIDAALKKAIELKGACFEHITLINTETGLEIVDLEELIREWSGDE